MNQTPEQQPPKKKMDPGVQIARIVIILFAIPIIGIILAMLLVFLR